MISIPLDRTSLGIPFVRGNIHGYQDNIGLNFHRPTLSYSGRVELETTTESPIIYRDYSIGLQSHSDPDIWLCIGPDCSLVNAFRSVSVLSDRLKLNQTLSEFRSLECLPDSVGTIPLRFNSEGRLADSVSVVPHNFNIEGRISVKYTLSGWDIPRTSGDMIQSLVFNTTDPHLLTVIPDYYGSIIQEIIGATGNVITENGRVRFTNCTRVRESLPTITLYFVPDRFNETMHLSVHPDDYTELRQSDDTCTLLVAVQDNTIANYINIFRLPLVNTHITQTTLSFCDRI